MNWREIKQQKFTSLSSFSMENVQNTKDMFKGCNKTMEEVLPMRDEQELDDIGDDEIQKANASVSYKKKTVSIILMDQESARTQR